MAAKEVWLWLLLVMRPHNPRTAYILAQCEGDAERAAREIRDGKFPFLTPEERRRAEQVRNGTINEVMRVCGENGVSLITPDEEEYPASLNYVENPPIVIFAAGKTDILKSERALTVVGTRNASDYGRAVAREIIPPLVKKNYLIVSGMAVGLDAAAHTACLDCGGKTAAVLGCGILDNYPKENAELKRRVVDNGGVIISELLPHAKSAPYYFHLRNRILAGLSQGTLVLEAGARSGSLITANLSRGQGKKVFFVPPHDITDERFSGAELLWKSGAVPVFGAEDIIEALEAPAGTAEKPVPKAPKTPKAAKAPKASKASKASKDSKASKEEAKEAPREPDESVLSALEPDKQKLLRLLYEKAMSLDELIELGGLDYGRAAEAVTDMEIFGYIVRNHDGTYSPA